jgi:hypothetical protein
MDCITDPVETVMEASHHSIGPMPQSPALSLVGASNGCSRGDCYHDNQRGDVSPAFELDDRPAVLTPNKN